MTVGWGDKRRQDKASQNIPKRGRRRLEKSSQDKTRQSKTRREDKARKGKTRQGKARQDKTRQGEITVRVGPSLG